MANQTNSEDNKRKNIVVVKRERQSNKRKRNGRSKSVIENNKADAAETKEINKLIDLLSVDQPNVKQLSKAEGPSDLRSNEKIKEIFDNLKSCQLDQVQDNKINIKKREVDSVIIGNPRQPTPQSTVVNNSNSMIDNTHIQGVTQIVQKLENASAPESTNNNDCDSDSTKFICYKLENASAPENSTSYDTSSSNNNEAVIIAKSAPENSIDTSSSNSNKNEVAVNATSAPENSMDTSSSNSDINEAVVNATSAPGNSIDASSSNSDKNDVAVNATSAPENSLDTSSSNSDKNELAVNATSAPENSMGVSSSNSEKNEAVVYANSAPENIMGASSAGSDKSVIAECNQNTSVQDLSTTDDSSSSYRKELVRKRKLQTKKNADEYQGIIEHESNGTTTDKESDSLTSESSRKQNDEEQPNDADNKLDSSSDIVIVAKPIIKPNSLNIPDFEQTEVKQEDDDFIVEVPVTNVIPMGPPAFTSEDTNLSLKPELKNVQPLDIPIFTEDSIVPDIVELLNQKEVVNLDPMGIPSFEENVENPIADVAIDNENEESALHSDKDKEADINSDKDKEDACHSDNIARESIVNSNGDNEREVSESDSSSYSTSEKNFNSGNKFANMPLDADVNSNEEQQDSNDSDSENQNKSKVKANNTYRIGQGFANKVDNAIELNNNKKNQSPKDKDSTTLSITNTNGKEQSTNDTSVESTEDKSNSVQKAANNKTKVISVENYSKNTTDTADSSTLEVKSPTEQPIDKPRIRQVTIMEESNQVINIEPSTAYAPTRLSFFPPDSILSQLKDSGTIKAEGYFFKKRDWFFCFWIEKYFVLLDTGELFYIEKDGTGQPLGNFKITNAVAFQELNYLTSSHPFRLSFSVDSKTGYFAYDNEQERNYWLDVLKDTSRG